MAAGQLDPAWRAGEWDSEALLFTGDLGVGADSGVAVPHAWMHDGDAPPVATLRRLPPRPAKRGPARAEFDSAPPPRATRPLAAAAAPCPVAKAICIAPGLCFRHERCWGKDRTEPVAMFIARARPLARPRGLRVAGCGRESISRRGLCRFHDNRLHRQPGLAEGGRSGRLDRRERPRLGVHQFSLAGLPELLRTELLYALQQRDQAPPPLDPTEVRILLARLGDAASLREADPRSSASPAACSTTPGPAACSAT